MRQQLTMGEHFRRGNAERQLSWPVGSSTNTGCREGRSLDRRPALAGDGGRPALPLGDFWCRKRDSNPRPHHYE